MGHLPNAICHQPSAISHLLWLPPGLFFLFETRTAEDVAQRVVALMAGVFVHLVRRRRPRILCRPRTRPRLRILDGELIAQRPGVEPRETLGDLQVFRRSPEARLVGEVRRLDDALVAVPAAD